jgi:hypothetical protein
MKIAHDPLPINASAEGYRSKKTGKLISIRYGKKTEKGLRPVGHRSVEVGFGLCIQQNGIAGVGVWLRYTGRGL